MTAYEYHHIVLFEDTNLVGNVYYLNHLRWQGHCRESFMREYAPEVLKDLADGLVLATTHCSCEYFAELHAFEHVVLRMRLAELTQTAMALDFEYARISGNAEELVAAGRQRIACLRRGPHGMCAEAVPPALRHALRAFATNEVGPAQGGDARGAATVPGTA